MLSQNLKVIQGLIFNLARRVNSNQICTFTPKSQPPTVPGLTPHRSLQGGTAIHAKVFTRVLFRIVKTNKQTPKTQTNLSIGHLLKKLQITKINLFNSMQSLKRMRPPLIGKNRQKNSIYHMITFHAFIKLCSVKNFYFS